MPNTFYQITKNEKNQYKKKKAIINIKYKNKMKNYYVECKKDTENIDLNIVRTKNNRLIMQSECTDCGNKNFF